MNRFQLWFPFTSSAIGINENDLTNVHNRPFAKVLAQIHREREWSCEQVYLTDRAESYSLQGDMLSRFFPLSFRWRTAAHSYGYQWSIDALLELLVRPPSAIAIFSAYGRFAKAVAFAAHARRVPYLVIVGGWYQRISRSQKWYFDHAYRVLVHTEMQKRALTEIGYRASNIVVFPLGIDTDVFRPKVKSRSNKHPGPRVLYVGRLLPSKGTLEALQAFEVLKRRFPAASMKIVGPSGDDEFTTRLRGYTVDHHLQESVIFAGPVPYEELPTFYQEADIFLFPSPYEGLPSVVLESMACGTTPVVLKGSGGTEEAISNGEDGWVIDAPCLAYEVLQIAGNIKRLKQSGERASRKIQEIYSIQRTYGQLRQILRELE